MTTLKACGHVVVWEVGSCLENLQSDQEKPKVGVLYLDKDQR